MKTRDGFVSNSSSTSFTVVLRSDAPVNALLSEVSVFDFLTCFIAERMENTSAKMLRSTVAARRVFIMSELVIIKKDRAFIDKRLKKVKSYARDKRLINALEQLHDDKLKIDYIRYRRDQIKWQKEDDYKPSTVFDRQIETLSRQIRELDQLKKEQSEMLEKIRVFRPDDVIISWTEDNWGEFRFVVDDMIDKGWLTVLERKGT